MTVVGAIDDNWVEGRSRNGEGIFPLSYVKILDDVDDDDDDRGGASRSSSQYGTPLHSRTVTPSFGWLEMFVYVVVVVCLFVCVFVLFACLYVCLFVLFVCMYVCIVLFM